MVIAWVTGFKFFIDFKLLFGSAKLTTNVDPNKY